MSHADYEDRNTATAADWDRQANEADDRNDREAQAKVDNRLTDAERRMAVASLAVFVTHLRRDMNLMPAGDSRIELHRADMRVASSAIAKLSGLVS
jgi:hypothetical protein